MEYFAGIDVSLEFSAIYIVDGRGKIIRESKLASDPGALVEFFNWGEIQAPSPRGWTNKGHIAAPIPAELLACPRVPEMAGSRAAIKNEENNLPICDDRSLKARGGRS